MKSTAREICWLVVFCFGFLITQAIAKPGSVKPLTTPAIDFTELDKLIPAELKEKKHTRRGHHCHQWRPGRLSKGVRRCERRDKRRDATGDALSSRLDDENVYGSGATHSR